MTSPLLALALVTTMACTDISSVSATPVTAPDNLEPDTSAAGPIRSGL